MLLSCDDIPMEMYIICRSGIEAELPKLYKYPRRGRGIVGYSAPGTEFLISAYGTP